MNGLRDTHHMFTKNEKPKGTAPAPAPEPTKTYAAPAQKAAPSIISNDLKITGDLHSNGDVHVDGTVDGDINARSVTVGEGAQITGRVSGDRVRLCGQLNGGVDAAMVELTRTARVEGDILHDSLQIEAGAFLEGQLRRREASAKGKSTNVTALSSSRSEDSGESEPAKQAVN